MLRGLADLPPGQGSERAGGFQQPPKTSPVPFVTDLQTCVLLGAALALGLVCAVRFSVHG